LERLREVKEAEPNAAHQALAELAKKKKDFLALTMNVDDLSERAGHAMSQLWHLHGRLLDIKCTKCDLLLGGQEAENAIRPLFDYCHPNPFTIEDVPRCEIAGCDGLLRPGVVWFTEPLPQSVVTSVSAWINNGPDDQSNIDSMLVIGTSALVYPATAYIEAARKKGARVAVVDIAKEDPSLLGLEEQDWYFQGNAATLVPEILKPVINVK
jgi:NAD-dependent SIR2 family protein deacetylase